MNAVRKIIDMETLQVWNTLTECARDLKVTPAAITRMIQVQYRVKGRRLEYLDFWLQLHPKDKERYSKKSNIFFLGA